MANVEVVLPKMGEGVIEAVLTRWLAEVNQIVGYDSAIAEIATDKVDSEIYSPAEGVLLKKFFSAGETVKVGNVIAIIETANNTGTDGDKNMPVAENFSPSIPKPEANPQPIVQPELIAGTEQNNNGPALFIRHYAKQRGISGEELQGISPLKTGSGVTKDDVLNYFMQKSIALATGSTPLVPGQHKIQETPETETSDGEEVIELSHTRKLIAGHMKKSVSEAPHVTSFIDVDITALAKWRENIKGTFESETGTKLTYTPIVAEIVVKALLEFPFVNVSLVGERLILKKYINLGIATALPDGNLVVPVIKNAQNLNLTGLALKLNDLVFRARDKKLLPGETLGGTFTITNLGQFGTITGTPIINQPESAILAIGAIKKRPWVVEISGEHTIGIRDVATLALSYDHRIIDGALGGAFLGRIAQLMENFVPTY
ncbi:MAG: 2-oxo acid dehydrogenase subunit E2 [Bacteroidales bacterium]|nr:2-oxo acid dehydrogenase subunit E2 [Bacteroidales bacterium]